MRSLCASASWVVLVCCWYVIASDDCISVQGCLGCGSNAARTVDVMLLDDGVITTPKHVELVLVDLGRAVCNRSILYQGLPSMTLGCIGVLKVLWMTVVWVWVGVRQDGCLLCGSILYVEGVWVSVLCHDKTKPYIIYLPLSVQLYDYSKNTSRT